MPLAGEENGSSLGLAMSVLGEVMSLFMAFPCSSCSDRPESVTARAFSNPCVKRFGSLSTGCGVPNIAVLKARTANNGAGVSGGSSRYDWPSSMIQ